MSDPAELEHPGTRGAAFGLLVMAPLFAAYEVGVAMAGRGSPRNLAELITMPPGLDGMSDSPEDLQTPVRLLMLGIVLFFSFVHVRKVEQPLVRPALRALLEGVLFALALGPLLLAAMGMLGLGAQDLGMDVGLPEGGVSVDRAARALGAGAWEELVFRLGGFSLVYFLVIRLLRFLGAGKLLQRGLSEFTAVVLSSVIFASAHLDVVTRVFDLKGEEFDLQVFLWRSLAGCLLAALFRLRGLGVTAWAHGLFNLALILGSGPGVFR